MYYCTWTIEQVQTYLSLSLKATVLMTLSLLKYRNYDNSVGIQWRYQK